MLNLLLIKSQFPNWDKKKVLAIGNSRQYKIIGCGKSAFKVLVYEPQPEIGDHPGWSQKFWPYDKIRPDTTAFKVVEKMQSQM